MRKSKNLFLGLDCSTQSLTAIVIDVDSGEAAFSHSLNFERDFPRYGTRAGAVTNPNNPLEVWSYPAMWLEALDAAMRAVSENVDAARIGAAACSGQQHASVWLKSPRCFEKRDPRLSLTENYRDAFATPRAPIWMDASTSRECREIAEAVGGDKRVLSVTGSVATERFTGAQIRKMSAREPNVYAAAGRIHLNSSFITSVLCGADAPIDFGDGTGMNLMDINRLEWSSDMLRATADGLAEKLPRLCPSDSAVGKISKYFSQKYGFDPETVVAAGTGDNPSSLVGVGAAIGGSAAISLGTSDTYFAPSPEARPAPNAHVFANPAGGYMNLICFRNGSLAREKVRDMLGASWDFFDREAFQNAVPREDDAYAVPFFTDEISPKVKSDSIMFFGKTRAEMNAAQVVRAAVEGQFFNMRIQAEKMSREKVTNIILTGGASKSDGLAQTAADVFGASVGRLMQTRNSAALGAAMRAAKCFGAADWKELFKTFCALGEFKNPRPEASAVHARRMKEFAKIIDGLAARQ